MEWIYDKANGSQFVCVELAEFMVEAGIDDDAGRGLVATFASQGLVKDESTFGGPAAVLRPAGVQWVEERRRRRKDPPLRSTTARNNLLRYFYDQDHAGVRYPETHGIFTTEGSFILGEQFTVDEIDRAAEDLNGRGLIDGISVAELRGPVRAAITVDGRECVEQYGGNVTEYLRDQRQAVTSTTNNIGTLNNSGALAVGSSGVTQHVTVGVDLVAMASFVKVLLAELPNLPLGQAAEGPAREALQTVQREVGRPDPQPEKIASAFDRFVGYLMDAGKPVVTAALMLAARHMGLPPA